MVHSKSVDVYLIVDVKNNTILILFPRDKKTNNVLWKCEYCGKVEHVTSSETSAVWLRCLCGKSGPDCNKNWYSTGAYFKRIPLSIRMKRWNGSEENVKNT